MTFPVIVNIRCCMCSVVNGILGASLEQWGVINYAARQLGLCMGVTGGKYVTTTEVYPDSPLVDGENCINAQVAAVVGGLDYVNQNST